MKTKHAILVILLISFFNLNAQKDFQNGRWAYYDDGFD